MIIKSICFDHKRINKGTWKAPNTGNVKMIDDVLVAQRHASSIIDVKLAEDLTVIPITIL